MHIILSRAATLKVMQSTEIPIEESKLNTIKELNFPKRNQKMRNKGAKKTDKTKKTPNSKIAKLNALQLKDKDFQMDYKSKTQVCIFHKRNALNTDTNMLKVGIWRKIRRADSNNTEAGVAVLYIRENRLQDGRFNRR